MKNKQGLQRAGVTIAITGFFTIVLSDGFDASISLPFGAIEVTVSTFTFGSGVIFLTKLTQNYSALTITASSLFLSGLILAAASASDSTLITQSE